MSQNGFNVEIEDGYKNINLVVYFKFDSFENDPFQNNAEANLKIT